MEETKYYDGTKLLSLMDINGKKPELYLCTTNRTGGKTTYFGRLCVNRFLDKGEKFILIYRYVYELDDIADKFFKDLNNLFFRKNEMTCKKRGKGVFVEMFIDDVSCGYAVALNNADQVKRYSHLFSDVQRGIFDEFQSETNHYCADEIQKLLSIHTSIARGNGEQVRYVPFYLLGNSVSIINPYYVELGIADRLRDDTKFLRGDGYVMEQGYIDSASKAQKESGFNRAFSKNKYVEYASQNVYLNDNKAFIDTPSGNSTYLATIKYNGNTYGIREYSEIGIVYCNDKADETYRNRVVVTTDDHDVNYVMLKKNDFFITTLRWYFEHGCFRFKDMRCKEAILRCLSY